MSEVSYGPINKGTMSVYLENTKIGHIEISSDNGFRYLPQGRKKWAGEWWTNLNDLKKSLEQE